MEGDVLEKLRTVFDVCDDKKEGYITTDHFKNLAKEHFGADSSEEIIGIIQILDPEGKGKINFEDFCKGVQQILDIHSPTSPVPLKDPFHLKNTSVEFDSLLTGEISPVDGPSGSSTIYTFNEYDINTDEDGSGLLIDLSTPEPVRRNIPTTILNGKTDLTDEDNFEDFGEIDDFESDVSSDHNQSCESCHKIRNRQGVIGHKHRRKSSGNRVTSALYASHLQTKARASPVEVLDDIDDTFQNLNDRVHFLENQVENISQEKQNTETVNLKLKDENHILIQNVMDRVMSLEENIKDVETKSNLKVAEEEKKFKDFMARLEQEKSEKVDFLEQRLQLLEVENRVLKAENPKLKLECDRLRVERVEAQEKLTETEANYEILLKDHEDLKLKYDKERTSTGQLLDELGKELGDLRQYKIETDTIRGRNNSQGELPGRYHSLQLEVNRLKEALTVEWRGLAKENRSLQETNEELNGQLLSRCITEGKNLTEGKKEQSLASELEHLTKEELMSKLQQQEVDNIRMQQYIDKMLLLILEKNPSLLEIS